MMCLICHLIGHIHMIAGYSLPPLPIFEEDTSYEVECVLPHEDEGSRSRPKKLNHIRWLTYALECNSWEQVSNLSV